MKPIYIIFSILFLSFFRNANAQSISLGCENGLTRYFQDSDGDGFGNDNIDTCNSSQPTGYVLTGGDCNDNNASINPSTTWYEDSDNDGFGDPGTSANQCNSPTGNWVLNNNDQCPNDAGISPDGCPSVPDPDPDTDPEPSSSGLSNENYLHVISYKKPYSTKPTNLTTDDIIEEVTYLDGLGRPKQNIKINQSVNGTDLEDLITEIDYDNYGRQTKEYLPYPKATTLAGAYQSQDLTKVRDFYYGKHENDFINLATTNAYSETSFEASPLSRVLKQAAPGYDWRIGGGHEIEFGYNTNVSGSYAGKVRHFEVDLSGGYDNPLLITTGYYDAGQLYKNVTRDENHISGLNNSTEELINKKGQVVLKRTYNNSVAHDTYYVYDDYGNLTYVIPPKADGTTTTVVGDTTKLNELCYQYKYDNKNRLVEKKIPGKGWEFIVYNKLDQPILTKDANLTGKWLYSKYDAFGRMISTGLHTHSATSQSAMQGVVDNYYVNNPLAKVWEEKPGANLDYSNQSYPTTNNEVLTLNYYDNYNFDTTTEGLLLTSGTNIFGNLVSYNVKGLPTGSKVKVLGQNPVKWITTISHYDQKGRNLYTGSHNEFLVTTDKVKMELDFTGTVKKTETYHKKGTAAAITAIDNFTYDHVNRLTQHNQTIGTKTELIAQNTYSKTGELIIKKVGNTLSAPLQTVNYSDNIRGWLKQINDPVTLGTDLFGFKINYNTTEMGISGVQPLYNGNISETIWRTAKIQDSYSQRKRGYGYQYDALNRLTNGQFRRANAIGTLFNEDINHYNVTGINYDKNGNIGKLNRRGVVNSTNGIGDMDKLDYIYSSNSNKLTAVQELTGGNSSYGFINGSTAATEYSYDVNGNLTSDANKGIQTGGIKYNHLNLPTEVKFNNSTSQIIKYTYDATGVKLKKEIPGKIIEYAGNYIYEYGNLKQFSHPEGYVEPDGNGGYDYVYSYLDHLGNVRLNYSDLNGNGTIETASEILDERNYYPFGLEHQGYNTNVISENNYKTFNGKELEKELGLEWTDYGARRYMKDLGRWTSIDPLANEFPHQSPNSSFNNNPIYFIDPDGKAAVPADWPPKWWNSNVNKWNELNNKEKNIVRWDPQFYKAFDIEKNANLAYSMTEATFEKQGKGDESDAFRHAFWQAKNTQDVGEDFTRKWSDAHEYGTPTNEVKTDLYMDVHNNDVGIEIGKANPKATPEELRDIILNRISKGDLLIINSINKLIKSDGSGLKSSEIRQYNSSKKIAAEILKNPNDQKTKNYEY